MYFYKLKEAAAAIATELHPASAADNSNDRRTDAERCYLTALQHAVCENEIVYRDPGTRLPVRRTGIEASLAAHSCIVSQHDLNVWLQGKGVGIQISDSAQVRPAPDNDDTTVEAGGIADTDNSALPVKPTSAQFAAAIATYLAKGRDAESLKKYVLGDIGNHRRLERYREMVPNGRREIALWEVGGVATYLIEIGWLTRERAREALAKHYPQHVYVLGECDSEVEEPTASWIVPGIG